MAGNIAQLAACLPGIIGNSGFHPQHCIKLGWACWYTPAVPALERCRQEAIQNHPCLASLRFEPGWDTGDPALGAAVGICNQNHKLAEDMLSEFCGYKRLVWWDPKTSHNWGHFQVTQENSYQWTPGTELLKSGDLGLRDWSWVHEADLVRHSTLVCVWNCYQGVLYTCVHSPHSSQQLKSTSKTAVSSGLQCSHTLPGSCVKKKKKMIRTKPKTWLPSTSGQSRGHFWLLIEPRCWRESRSLPLNQPEQYLLPVLISPMCDTQDWEHL